MQANRGRDTVPELAIRSILHKRGMRFRVNHPLPFNMRRRADITFTKVDLYVFVDGCFWHGCSDHYVRPKTRAAYWASKIRENVDRDDDTATELRLLGACVLRFWEHEDPESVADAIQTKYVELAYD